MKDIEKLICDIKIKYWAQRKRLFGTTYFETQEYKGKNISIPMLDEYIIERMPSKIVSELIVSVIGFILCLLMSINSYLDSKLNYETILLIIVSLVFIGKFFDEYSIYYKHEIILKASSINLELNLEKIIWKNVLTIHFIDISGRLGSFNELVVNFINENDQIIEKKVNIKYLNYTEHEICNILTKYYLYENIYKRDY